MRRPSVRSRLLAPVLAAAVLIAAPPVMADDAAEATRALFEAVRANDLAKAQVSLAQGADVNAVDAFGKTPADLAVDRGFFELAHFILAHRAQPKPVEPEAVAVALPPPPPIPQPEPVLAASPAPPPIPAPPPAAGGTNPFEPSMPLSGAAPAPLPGTVPEPATTPSPSPVVEEASPPPPASPEPAPVPERTEEAPSEPGFLDRIGDFFSRDETPSAEPMATPEPEPEVAADPEPTPLPEPVATPAPVEPPPPVEPPRPAPVASWLGDRESHFEPMAPLTAPPAPDTRTAAMDSPVDPEPGPAATPANKAAETFAEPAAGEEPEGFFDRIADALSSLGDGGDPPPKPTPVSPTPTEPTSAPAEPPATDVAPGQEVTLTRQKDFMESISDFFSWGGEESPETSSEQVTEKTGGDVTLERPTPVSAWLGDGETPFDPERRVARSELPDPASVPAPPRVRPASEEQLAAHPAPAPPELPPEEPLQPFLSGFGLTLAGDLRLDRTRDQADTDAGNCIKKRSWVGTYCVVAAHWPPAVAPIFGVRTHLYSGTKAVVRYDANRATRYHVQFPTEAWEGVITHFASLYGPPTSRPTPRRVWTGETRTENPIVRWETVDTEGRIADVLEVRKFDDVSGMFPDSRFGFIQLRRAGAGRIFNELSSVDLALLYIARTRPKAPSTTDLEQGQ